MPRRWKALIFLAALLATTLSFASFASAHTDNVKVLHLRGVQVESQFVDVAPTGEEPSLGDSFVLSENLLRDGKKVGISGVVCTFVRVANPPGAVERVITARIGGDELTVQGLSFDQPAQCVRDHWWDRPLEQRRRAGRGPRRQRDRVRYHPVHQRPRLGVGPPPSAGICAYDPIHRSLLGSGQPRGRWARPSSPGHRGIWSSAVTGSMPSASNEPRRRAE